MSKGRRYNEEKKLNFKKVFGCVIIIAALILFVIAINKILEGDSSNANKNTEISYHLMYQNSKWGVIDNLGKTIIDASYDELIQIPDSAKPIFICTYEVDYENGTFKTKVLNDKQEEILKDYELVTVIDNFSDAGYWYENNVLKFKKENMYGLINYEGNVILNPEYQDIYTVEGHKNNLVILKDSKYGVINNLGEVIVERKYDSITYLKESNSLECKIEGQETETKVLADISKIEPNNPQDTIGEWKKVTNGELVYYTKD